MHYSGGNAAARLVPAFEMATLTAAALFAGAGLYITMVEGPARLATLTQHKKNMNSKRKAALRAALLQWYQSYHRAAPFQAFNASLSCVGGLCSTFALGQQAWPWAWGGALVGANIPLTLVLIMPLNMELMKRAETAMDDEDVEEEAAEEEEEEEEPVPLRICFGSWAIKGVPSVMCVCLAFPPSLTKPATDPSNNHDLRTDQELAARLE